MRSIWYIFNVQSVITELTMITTQTKKWYVLQWVLFKLILLRILKETEKKISQSQKRVQNNAEKGSKMNKKGNRIMKLIFPNPK